MSSDYFGPSPGSIGPVDLLWKAFFPFFVATLGTNWASISFFGPVPIFHPEKKKFFPPVKTFLFFENQDFHKYRTEDVEHDVRTFHYDRLSQIMPDQ